MKTALLLMQIIIAIGLIGLIIMQARGTGLGRTFAASSTSFSRRGVERLVYKTTFFLAGLFIVISILQTVI